MARSQELLERLAAADEALHHERMSKAASRRVARHLSRELDALEQPSRGGWMPMLTFVAGAALVLLFLRWSTTPTPSIAEAEQARPEMAVLVSGDDCRAESAETTTTRGACRVTTRSPSMTIDTIDGTELEVAGRTVHLRTGSALFDVEKVRGEPIRVAVPQGEIVVVGTRFRVVVDGTRTEVELYEGALEFRDESGKVTPIFAGQLIGFGGTAAPVPPVAPAVEPARDEAAPAPVRPSPRSKPAAEHAPASSDAGPVIEEAERFRREGRYAEAATVLRDALKRRWPRRTAEVLSYELGRILERRMKDAPAACEHWQAHLKRFERSRYRARIERSMKTLACD
ncbi:MAG: FecR domain-containing protein [Nannocystaceae bacterium]|nr:FecR family protein [bacterium]